MIMYELKNVSKTYQIASSITHALDNVSVTIEEGEIVVILGPSGSGKSTLLNVLSGIDQASQGTIVFMGQDLSLYQRDQLTEYRRLHLGFIFQTYNLISNLTVRENAELGQQLSKNPLNLDELLQILGLKEQEHKFPYQLSGGQQQRVAIARALVKNPRVLFCDEPTGALDEETGKIILDTIQEINRKYRTTVVIITHNPSIALMANTVIRLNSGRVVELKKNEKILSAREIRWA